MVQNSGKFSLRLEGFTLVEIIIGLALASGAALLMSRAFLQNQQNIANQDARVSFLFPRLLVQQTIRDNPQVICPDMAYHEPLNVIASPQASGSPQPSPSPSYAIVPLESEVIAYLAAPSPKPSDNAVEKFFDVRPISKDAPSLGVIANSSPIQFTPYFSFKKLGFKCLHSEKADLNEVCTTQLEFGAVASPGFKGLVPPSDKFPAELIVRKSDRKLMGCKISGLGGAASVPVAAVEMDYSKLCKKFKINGFLLEWDAAEQVCKIPCQEQTLTYSNPGVQTVKIPDGCTKVDVWVYGGGGAGGMGGQPNGGNFSSGSGGGGGGYAQQMDVAVTPGQSYTVTVGAGGAVSIPNWSNTLGKPGSPSSFENLVVANGGGGGQWNGPAGLGGAGVTGTTKLSGTSGTKYPQYSATGGNGGVSTGPNAGSMMVGVSTPFCHNQSTCSYAATGVGSGGAGGGGNNSASGAGAAGGPGLVIVKIKR